MEVNPNPAANEESEPVEACDRQGDKPIGAQVWHRHIEHLVGEGDDGERDGSTGATRIWCGIRVTNLVFNIFLVHDTEREVIEGMIKQQH